MMIFCEKDGTAGGSKGIEGVVEIPDSELDLRYVQRHVLSTTDKFLENQITGNLRVWHLILMASGAFAITVIVMCCLFRCRIPRTKTEIEANAKRRALLKNFNAKLKNLKAAELDDLDYRKALDKLREEFKADTESLAQSEAISILSVCDDLAD